MGFAAKPAAKASAKVPAKARAKEGKGPPPVVALSDDPPKAVSAREAGQGPPPVVDWLDENGSLKAGKGSIKARSFFSYVTGQTLKL